MKPYKAVFAFLIAFIGALVTATQSGGISTNEWLIAALAGLVAGGGTYGISNGAR